MKTFLDKPILDERGKSIKVSVRQKRIWKCVARFLDSIVKDVNKIGRDKDPLADTRMFFSYNEENPNRISDFTPYYILTVTYDGAGHDYLAYESDGYFKGDLEAEFENKPEFFSKPDDYLLMKKFINDSRELLDKQNLNIKEYTFKGKQSKSAGT